MEMVVRSGWFNMWFCDGKKEMISENDPNK